MRGAVAPHTQRIHARGRADPGGHASGMRPSTLDFYGRHSIDGSPQHRCIDRPPRCRSSIVSKDYPSCPGLGMSPALTTEREAYGHDASD